MKTSTGSYLLSLASAIAGAIVGAFLVAIPFALRNYAQMDERIAFFMRWIIPFVAGFAILYGLTDWLVRRKYLAIRRWTRAAFQSLL